jgi:hypothetical protein
MNPIFRTLDNVQMFQDIEDYLVIVEGELDVIERNNQDYSRLTSIQNSLLEILDRLDEINYNHTEREV